MRMYVWMIVATVAFVLSGCGPSFQSATATQAGGSASLQQPAPAGGSKACVSDDPGQALVRRLSNAEIKYSVQDLLGVANDVTESLPHDIISTDNFSNNAGLLAASSAFVDKYVPAIEKAVTDAMTANTALSTCPTGTSGAACVKALVGKLARRAFRRTLKSEELGEIQAGASALISGGATLKEALAAEYQKLLLSAKFLFRSGFGASGTSGDVKSLTQFELASRLSYFLWVSPPDEALLAKAEKGELADSAVLRSEIQRLLRDPKAERFAKLFVGEWTELGRLSRNDVAPELRADVVREAELLFLNVLKSDVSAMDLLTADYSFLNDRLAQHYGVSGVTGGEFRRVGISATPRRGLLTGAAFSMLTSSSGASKPTGRGNRILTNIICSPPPPFPDGITITPLEPDTGLKTIRERLEVHRSSASCIGCHSEMDPIGFALESFDQFGKFRTSYSNGLAVDPSGAFRGRNFGGHSDLITILSQENGFKSCITRKLMTFAIGRSFESRGSDQCMTQTIGGDKVKPDSKFSDLVFAIVTSDAFTKNRTQSQGEL